MPKQKNKKTKKIDDCLILSFAIPHFRVVLHLLIPWENLGLECWCLREEEFRVHAEKYLGRGNELTKITQPKCGIRCHGNNRQQVQSQCCFHHLQHCCSCYLDPQTKKLEDAMRKNDFYLSFLVSCTLTSSVTLKGS